MTGTVIAVAFVGVSAAIGGVIGLCWSGLVVLILSALSMCTREEYP